MKVSLLKVVDFEEQNADVIVNKSRDSPSQVSFCPENRPTFLFFGGAISCRLKSNSVKANKLKHTISHLSTHKPSDGS